MTQLYAQPSQQGIWMALGPPTSAAFALGQSLTITYGDGTQDTLAAHVPAVTSAGTTQVDRTGAVWLLYVIHGDPTLRIVREMDQGQVAGSYAALARVLADRVVPYQPDSGQAQSSTSGQSYLPLTVTNNSSTQSIGGSTAVPVATSSTDYVVQCHLSGSAASAVWNALSDKTALSDVQVLFAGAEIDADLDGVTNGAWGSTNITLWFRLQRPIAASGTDSGYQLRLGGGVRSSPPRSWANIYPLSDDFPGSTLDGSKWSGGTATVSLSGGVATVSSSSGSAYLQSAASFGASYLASMYGTLPPEPNQFCTFGLRSSGLGGPLVDLASLNDNFGTPLPWQLRESSGGAAQTANVGTPDGGGHVFFVARDAAGAAYGAAGASAAGPLSTYPTTAALPVYCSVNSASTANPTLDWVKVRPYVHPEPTVAAGTLQSAGALVWQPITDSSGSVLVDSSGNPIMALSSL